MTLICEVDLTLFLRSEVLLFVAAIRPRARRNVAPKLILSITSRRYESIIAASQVPVELLIALVAIKFLPFFSGKFLKEHLLHLLGEVASLCTF